MHESDRIRIQAQLDRAANTARQARAAAQRARAAANALQTKALGAAADEPGRVGLFAEAQAAVAIARQTEERADNAERVVHTLSDQLTKTAGTR